MVVNNQQLASMLPRNQSSFVQHTGNSVDVQLSSTHEINSNGFSTKEKISGAVSSEALPDYENTNSKEKDNDNYSTFTNNNSSPTDNTLTLSKSEAVLIEKIF